MIFFVNLKEERLHKLVARMDDYFESGLSMSELYRVLIYHISKYTSLFEDIDYEEIKDKFPDPDEADNDLSRAQNILDGVKADDEGTKGGTPEPTE